MNLKEKPTWREPYFFYVRCMCCGMVKPLNWFIPLYGSWVCQKTCCVHLYTIKVYTSGQMLARFEWDPILDGYIFDFVGVDSGVGDWSIHPSFQNQRRFFTQPGEQLELLYEISHFWHDAGVLLALMSCSSVPDFILYTNPYAVFRIFLKWDAFIPEKWEFDHSWWFYLIEAACPLQVDSSVCVNWCDSALFSGKWCISMWHGQCVLHLIVIDSLVLIPNRTAMIEALFPFPGSI